MDATVERELGRAADGPITVDLTTTGRASGLPRRIEIWLIVVDDRILIGGTPGRRDWLANIRADPGVVLHLKEGATADLAATATEVTDPEFRARVWSHASTTWYRTQAPLDALVAESPLIELELA